MKYLKLYEEHKNQIPDVEFKLYTLTEHTESESESIYGVWSNIDDAKTEAEIHDSGFPDTDSTIELTTYNFKIPYLDLIAELDYDLEDVEDMSNDDLIDEFKDIDFGNLDEFYDTDNDTLDSFDRTNKSSDQLIDDVIEKLNDKLNRNYRNGFSKYTSLYKDEDGKLTFESDNGLDFDDENYEEHERVNIRIGDHTHNPRNGRNDLNVLIVNDDKTKNRFFTARTDLKYNSGDDADEIVDDIINYWV